MSENLFDKFVQDKLKDHSSALPPDMWERIRPENEPEPKGSFWTNNAFRIFLLITALSGVMYFISTNNRNTSLASDNKKRNTSTIPASSLKITKEGKNSTGNTLNEVAAKDDVLQEKNIQDNTSLVHRSNHHSLLAANPLTNKKINSGFGLSRRSSFLNAETKREINTIEVGVFERGDYSLKSFAKAATVNEKNSLLEVKSKQYLSEHLKNYVFTSGIECPSFADRKRSDLFIEVFASPDYAVKKVSGNGGLDQTYLRRKDSSENMRASFSAGFRLTKSLGENLRLKTGLQYSQINERLNYRIENERRLRTVVTVRTIIRSTGDTLMFSDTSTFEEIGYLVKNTNNRYRSIDVPVLLGYEWGNESWKIGVTTGAIFNLRSWQQGASLDTSYVPVDFNKPNGQFFKKNIGVGIYAGVSFLKSIGEKTEFFAEPYVRYNISNMTNQGLLNQKIHVAGLNLGVRYKIRSAGQR